ncbi:SUMF1/EgtB/PvdO family nonheme iron enzyme [Ideonella sp. 4Y16]|uniref:SUMF1/EgtB/PvdO family nonheme iron enzyme n=1 Tax=Ideonella alba TaxID=2824118 RepID=UPI001B387C7A|nr:SUMF1/EgtB/PvdO family nonheme iron enzyme [Ideonella alba]MBQ0942226.1 SUMF1/EgtB/PvdO family nonheme iron enzyme [Ideonella alba]
MPSSNAPAPASPPPWPEISQDQLLALVPRDATGWPGLFGHALRLAQSGDHALRAHWLQAWPAQAAALFAVLAEQRPANNPLLWPTEETPRQQLQRVLYALFCAHDQALESERQVPPDTTPYGQTLLWRDAALQDAAGQLALNPQHPANPGERGDPAIAQVQLLVDDSLRGALRAVLRLRLVPAPGAFLAFVPAPANALTFCARSFVDALDTVTRLLRRLLAPGRAELQHMALQWNLHTPEYPLLAVEGPSAGAAFSMAALSLLQQHLDPAEPALRQALAAVALQPGLLAQAGISIAIDEHGQLHPVGAAPDKALAYQHRRPGRPLPMDAQHLFLHPDNHRELDVGLLPHVHTHPVASLPELLHEMAQAAQPRPAFRDVLAQMPLHAPPEDDDQQPPPPADQRELLDRQCEAAWHERDQVRNLRDYLIVRWAWWARHSQGELHMRFVPLALKAAAGSEGLAPTLPTVPLPGLSHLLRELHDADRGEDRAKALLLQGQAGAGKSTLLQRHEQALALDGLRRLLAGPQGAAAADDTTPIELPLYLPLASLPADVPDPLAWVRSRAHQLYPAFDELHDLLAGRPTPRWQRVQLRLLLDGLNELPEPPHTGRFQRAQQVLDRLTSELKLRLAPLLSARGHHGFDQLSQVQRGACVQVQPWPADMVCKYVARCFSQRGDNGQVSVHPSGQALIKALNQPEHRHVLDLCATPFNSAGQVRLWAGGRQKLVRHRADLYARLLREALLRELGVNHDDGSLRNPLFHDPALITPEERRFLQDPSHWEGDEVTWPDAGGALLPGLFRQALAQWLGTDRPPEERGTVEVPLNHPRDPQRSVAHWLAPATRHKWLRAVRDLGMVAEDTEGRGQRFRFMHQSWGEYLASVRLLAPTPEAMPPEPLAELQARLQQGRAFERSAEDELAHQRQQADQEWWQGAPGQAWWRSLLAQPLPLRLSDVKREIGWPEHYFAEHGDVERSAWGDWQRLHADGALELDAASDSCSITLQGWGDMLVLAELYGRPGQPWAEQAACVRALVLQHLWTPWQTEVRRRLTGHVGEDRARDLWRSNGALALPSVGSLDEVLGLALLALPRPGQQAWLRWLLQHGLWAALQPALPELQRQLEDGATAWAAAPPCGVLQHLRRVLLLRQLDAGAAARTGVEASGQAALLASRDADCDAALAAHWRQEQAQAFQGPGRDLRERLHAAQLLGLLGDNLRYEAAAAASGTGLRPKPALWAGVGQPGRDTAHRIGDEPGDAQAWPNEQRAFNTPPLPYYQVARLPLTCAEWRFFVQAGGYNPQAEHWRLAGPAAQQWLQKYLKDTGLRWQDYQPEALDDADWGWALNPVTTINVFEAVAYACWARPMVAGTAGAPAAPGQPAWWLCLPTEVLWEAAQRAGADGLPAPVPRPLPAAQAPAAQAFNHAATGWNRPSPVGLFSAAYGPAGQADGQGNVWEWCGNALPAGPRPYHHPGSQDEAQARWNGALPTLQTPRALRGGAFDVTAAQCRASCRGHNLPGSLSSGTGVRFVRVWPPHSEP